LPGSDKSKKTLKKLYQFLMLLCYDKPTYSQIAERNGKKGRNPMALVIDLKPQEKILIGSAVITNSAQRTRLHIAGDAPILREKDIMTEDEADTPCKRAYFLVQCMYMSHTPKEYHQRYFDAIKEIQNAAPSSTIFFVQINEHIIAGTYYKAMKLAQQLIDHEKELLSHVTK
jgi:flagellar biosynthesis repressor protein FlbT